MSLKKKDAPDLGLFNWEDPFRLDSQLSEQERMLTDAARDYAQTKLQPRASNLTVHWHKHSYFN